MTWKKYSNRSHVNNIESNKQKNSRSCAQKAQKEQEKNKLHLQKINFIGKPKVITHPWSGRI